MQIISKGQRVTLESYSLVFDDNDDPLAGFSFPCDAEGHLLLSEQNPQREENLKKCQDGTYNVRSCGVQRSSHSYWQPAVGKCQCGRSLELPHFTNTCTCGLSYNSCGQLLAPRSQWEEPYYASDYY